MLQLLNNLRQRLQQTIRAGLRGQSDLVERHRGGLLVARIHRVIKGVDLAVRARSVGQDGFLESPIVVGAHGID